jgi:large subunit ribosomal protein L19
MSNLIDEVEKKYRKDRDFNFNIGDTIRILYKTVTGGKERIQPFEGICIAKKNAGIKENFTVRRFSHGVGVERTFPLHSPKIIDIEIKRRGNIRRAKLYYLRDRVGRKASVKDKKEFFPDKRKDSSEKK